MKIQKSKVIGTILKLERVKQGVGQKEICHGICVPSYLSKIENGLTNADQDIISQLFKRLHIQYEMDEKLLQILSSQIEEYYKKLHYGLTTSDVFKRMEEYKEKYLYSYCVVDYLLIECFEKKQFNELLNILENTMNDKQKAYFILVKAFTNTNKAKLRVLKEQCKRSADVLQNTYALYAYCTLCFNIDDYSSVLKSENMLINYAIEEGNTILLANYYYLKGTLYGALQNTPLMIECYERYINFLQKQISDEQLEMVYYNLGASYLEVKEFDKAHYYLIKIKRSKDVLRMLSLLYIRKNQSEEAKKYLDEWKLIINKEDSILEQLKYEEACFECEENYLKNPQYLEIVEKLIDQITKSKHIGHLLFYKENIMQAYRYQRKYKKALDFERVISSKISKYII